MRKARWILTFMLLPVTLGLPLQAFQKQSEQPWWVDFLAQRELGSGDGMHFQWNSQTRQYDAVGVIEFAFTRKSAYLDFGNKTLMMKLYRNAIKRFWSLPFDASDERADLTVCGESFSGFNFDGLVFRVVAENKPVAPNANRVYFYYDSQVPKDLEMQDILHMTYPTIAGPEGYFELDPFWARKGEGVLPAFTQFLPLPKDLENQPSDEFGPRDPSTSSWQLFAGHEFGHALGLADGWFIKDDQVIATDTELMSYLFWELNPEPRSSHKYFADILTRVFQCDVSWQENGKTHWVGPGQ